MKEDLPKISQFEQKKKFIEHLKDKKYENCTFHEMTKEKLFGVKGENYKAYINYFIEFRCITNKID